jgi:glyoxylase-like metal-dependent hydrolase (beta-lactamase superfamily II)
MLQRDVVPGVHRLEEAFTNVYLIEDDGRLTVVDCGFPATWGTMQSALSEIGRTPSDVDAIVLTHAHFDHVGFAERARTQWHAAVWVHERDASLSRHPLYYEHERSPVVYPMTHPAALRIVGAMMARGMFLTKGVGEVRAFSDEQELDVPGRPRPVFCPGHTHGHVALHMPDRGALIAGDAIVTLDPYTAKSGPRIVAGAATADSDQALASLQALADTGAQHVLPGHGPPWHEGIGAAVERAREAGPS